MFSGMHTLQHDQLDDIVYDGANLKPSRKLIAQTALMALVLDIEAQVDIAAGGGNSGTVNAEHVARMVNRIRVYDGTSNPIVDAEARELLQLSKRRGINPNSGADLANGGVQAATQVRQQIVIPLSDPWTADPYEVHLRPTDPDKYRVEIEWAGLGLTTGSAAPAVGTIPYALISGGDRAITVSNLKVKLLQIHDPVAFLKRLPIFLPRIVSYNKDVPGVSANFAFEIDTARHVRFALLHTTNAGVTAEGIVNKLSLKDDQRTYRAAVYARSWHEYEQWKFGGLDDVSGLDLAYFGLDFAQNGKLGNVLAPRQGGNPRWVLDVTGGANRQVQLVQVELERVPGLTLSDAELPPGLRA